MDREYMSRIGWNYGGVRLYAVACPPLARRRQARGGVAERSTCRPRPSGRRLSASRECPCGRGRRVGSGPGVAPGSALLPPTRTGKMAPSAQAAPVPDEGK